jgi:hypothetical protein
VADLADYTVDGLLTAIRDAAGVGPSVEDNTDARFLRLMNRVQGLDLAALLKRCEAKHRTATLDLTVTASLSYDIPRRAVAAGLTKVEGVDASGQTWMLYEFEDEQRARWWPRNGHFYVKGNQIVFYQTPPAGVLRFTYQRRLNQLVQTSAVGVIAAGGISGGTLTVTAAPSSYPTASTPYDLVRATPHFDLLAMEVNATRSGNVFTFSASDVPSGLEVGDYICRAGQSAVCQAPYELHAVLAQLVAMKWLEAKGDPRVSVAAQDLSTMEKNAMMILAPRIEREAPLSNPYSPGWSSQWRGFRRP